MSPSTLPTATDSSPPEGNQDVRRYVRWLHLSDLHFRGDEAWDRRTVVKALLRHAKSLVDDGLAPDLVFVTGDVAWSGKRGEYEQAQRFFTKLGEILGLGCREKDDRDLLTYVHEQTRNQLQLPVPAGFLEDALEEGRAVLLLDGLDEVGSAEDREEMRGRVQAFLLRYPRVPALVTSRIAGYDDAPLPERRQRSTTSRWRRSYVGTVRST